MFFDSLELFFDLLSFLFITFVIIFCCHHCYHQNTFESLLIHHEALLPQKEHVKEKKVIIEHVSIKLMIVDPLTKGMPPKTFKNNVVQMGLISMM